MQSMSSEIRVVLKGYETRMMVVPSFYAYCVG